MLQKAGAYRHVQAFCVTVRPFCFGSSVYALAAGLGLRLFVNRTAKQTTAHDCSCRTVQSDPSKKQGRGGQLGRCMPKQQPDELACSSEALTSSMGLWKQRVSGLLAGHVDATMAGLQQARCCTHQLNTAMPLPPSPPDTLQPLASALCFAWASSHWESFYDLLWIMAISAVCCYRICACICVEASM